MRVPKATIIFSHPSGCFGVEGRLRTASHGSQKEKIYPSRWLESKYKTLMLVKFVSDNGSFPVKKLPEKSSSPRACKLPLFPGMQPVNKLLWRSSLCNFNKLVKESGMEPDKQLKPIWRVVRLDNLPSVLGRDPNSQFSKRSNSFSFERLPMLSETGPIRMLLEDRVSEDLEGRNQWVEVYNQTGQEAHWGPGPEVIWEE